jgi:putative membrane protein
VLIFLAVVVLVVYLVVRVAGHGTHDGSSGETPEQIAKKRYARGEISKVEFDKLLEELKR